MAQTDWVLIALGGFVLLLLILFLVSKLFPNEFAEYDRLREASKAPPGPWPGRPGPGGGFVHIGAPSPGARTPPWLAKARKQQAAEKAAAEQAARVAPPPSPEPAPPLENWLRRRVGAQPLEAAVRRQIVKQQRETVRRRERQGYYHGWDRDDEYHNYPDDADWDDHDVDWGETR